MNTKVQERQQTIGGGGPLSPGDDARAYYTTVQPPGDPAPVEHERPEQAIGAQALIGTVSRLINNTMSEDAGGNSTAIAVETTWFPYIHGNYLHPSRAGGPAYYQTPGVMPADRSTAGGFIMPLIRKSKSEGVDTTKSVSLSVNIPTKDLLAQLEDMTAEGGFGGDIGGTISTNAGDSRMIQSVQDIDGDGIADILQQSGNSLSVISGGRSGFNGRYAIAGINDINVNHNDASVMGASISAAGSISISRSGSGKISGISMNGSASGGGSRADSTGRQRAGLVDLNGDGLPDYVESSSVKLYLGRERGFEALPGFTEFEVNKSETATRGVSMSLGTGGGASGKKNIDTGSYTAAVNIGLGGGLNYSVSMTETEQMLQDMNGDGLPDKVIKLPPVIDMTGTVTESGALRVYYNTGSGFASEAVEFDTPDWSIGEDEINHFKTRTDGNLLTALFSQLPLVGNKLSTVFYGQFGNGYALNPLGADIQKYLNRLELTSSISTGLSISANAGGNVSIILTAVKLNFTLGGGGGFNTGASVSGVSMRLEYTPYGELWIDWRSNDAPEDGTPYRFMGKELDPETGLYYYGARYLDPKTSRWISGDPALGEYIPVAPVNDEAKKRNGNLPGQGGVFNYVNLHVYHYAGNNPVKYTDPDGNDLKLVVSKSQGTMEITRTGTNKNDNRFVVALEGSRTISVITSVTRGNPGANNIRSETSTLKRLNFRI
jgi:RHS repeat-associated protein